MNLSYSLSSLYLVGLKLTFPNAHNDNLFYPLDMPLYYVNSLYICTSGIGFSAYLKALIFSFAFLNRVPFSFVMANWQFVGPFFSMCIISFALLSCCKNWVNLMNEITAITLGKPTGVHNISYEYHIHYPLCNPSGQFIL